MSPTIKPVVDAYVFREMTKLTFAIKEVNRCQLKRNHVDDLTKFLIVLLRTEGLIHSLHGAATTPRYACLL